MNILIANPYLACGGTEERVLALASEFRNRGHKTSFLIYGEPGTVSENPDFTVYKTTANMSAVIAAKIIERDKVNLVQQHNWQQVGLGAIQAAKKAKLPAVYYAHDFCSICCRRFMADGMSEAATPCVAADPRKCELCAAPYNLYLLTREREILEQADVGVSPSDYFTATLEAHGVLKGRWRKVTPWISPLFRDLFWSGYTSNTILFAGNLTYGKGVHTLVKALPKVAKEIPDVQLRLAGGVAFHERVVLEARKLKVVERVFLLNVLPPKGLALEYVNAGVVCFPSNLPEAFGLVWAEAMTVGAPVVCSSVGSIPEYVRDYAPLVKPGDVDGWAEAILTIFQDRSEAVKLAEKAREYAEKTFSVERAADEILKIYEGLV